jgi:hypothetical protein
MQMGTNLNDVSMPIFTRPEDAPPGHIPLSQKWSSKESPRDRERVRRGIQQRQVNASRLMTSTSDDGELWVDFDQAVSWLAGWERRSVSGAATTDAKSRIVGDVHLTLQRIASALERIADCACPLTDQKVNVDQ